MFKKVILFVLVSVGSSLAANRYVDNKATGANNGTSWADAWKSLDSISGVKGGDTVFISDGTYNIFCFFPPSGAANNPVTYRVGQDPGHNGMVIFHPAANHDSQAIYLSPGSGWGNWVTIDGEYQGQRHLQIDGGWGATINTGGAVTGFTIRYATLNGQIRMDDARKFQIAFCYWNAISGIDRCIVNAGRGDNTGYGNNSIHDNTFNLLYQHGANSVSGNGDDAMANLGSCDIYNNRFIGVLVPAFNGNQHGDAIQTDGRYFRIYNNYFENVGSNYGIYAEYGGGGGSDWQIFNNVFNMSDATLTKQPTQLIAVGAHGNGTWTNWYIFNNTFRGGAQALAFGDASGQNSFPGSYLKNNVTMVGGGGLNVWNGTVPNTSNNLTNVAANYFVNPSAGDFHLTSAATGLIDKGSSAGLTGITTKDADGKARGSTWDIGAYEYGGTAPTPSPTATPQPTPTPPQPTPTPPQPTPTPPVPTPTPLPTPPEFVLGTRIELTATETNVRSSPGIRGDNLLGTQAEGVLGTLVEGPSTVSSDPHVWWRVDFDTGVDGWCGQDNFKVSTTPSPTPVPTPTPPQPTPTPEPTPTPPPAGSVIKGNVTEMDGVPASGTITIEINK